MKCCLCTTVENSNYNINMLVYLIEKLLFSFKGNQWKLMVAKFSLEEKLNNPVIIVDIVV